MLLQRLVEFANLLDEQELLAPPLYSKKWVRYVIEIDNNGRLLNSQPVDLSKANGSAQGRRGQLLSVPHTTRSANIQPLLLADHAEYTLGLERENVDPERAMQCHDAYLRLLEECTTQTEDPVLSAVLNFLVDKPLERLDLDEGFDRNSIIVFQVGDLFAHDRPAAQRFWVDHLAAQASSEEGIMECLVCGESRPALKSLNGKIKGIPGGQTVGTSIISANRPAFESYGLERSHIAPICANCGDRFTKALNHLLRDDTKHLLFSSLIFAFWAQKPVSDFTFASWLNKPEPQAVHDLIDSVRNGKGNPIDDETPFYAVSLSGSGGRAVVRDWLDTTVGQVKTSLVDWFRAQAIVSDWSEEPQPLSINALAGATVRDLQDVKPPTYRTLLRAGLIGTPLPWNLLQQAVRRSHAERADRKVTRPRAALIKLVMASQNIIKEDEMVQLQTEHPERAYHCGRLLAILESIQRRAIGNISATIVDRYYGTASTSPAFVFGRLLRDARPHLSKLRRDRPGTVYALQKRLEEVVAALPAFPTTLDLKQQGFFALGYYHQRAHDRAQVRAYQAQKRAEAQL